LCEYTCATNNNNNKDVYCINKQWVQSGLHITEPNTRQHIQKYYLKKLKKGRKIINLYYLNVNKLVHLEK
jgi:hypothetical protein